MESLKDAAILLGHDMPRQDIKDVFDSIKGKIDVKYKDIQNKDSRRLVKQLVEAKLKDMKKLKRIVKTEKKRKRDDEKEEKRSQGQGQGR